MGTTPKQELAEACPTWRFSCWWSTPAAVCSSCSSQGLGSLEHVHSMSHNSQVKCKMRPYMPQSYYGDSHNCLYGSILESLGGKPGVLRQYSEKGNSHDGTQRLPKPFLVSSVLFSHSQTEGGIWPCAHLPVHSWRCTNLAISQFPNTVTGKYSSAFLTYYFI